MAEILFVILKILMLISITNSMSRSDSPGCNISDNGPLYNCTDLQLHSIPDRIPNQTQQLILRANSIEKIPNRVFEDVPNLTLLDLSDNRISVISTFAFANLTSLTHLDLHDNVLDSYSFEQNCFSPLKSLLTLNIKKNNFGQRKAYPAAEIQKLTNLKHLEIDVFLGFQFGEEFTDLKTLESLELDGKHKYNIQNNSFEAFSGANISYFSFNMVYGQFIPDGIDFLRSFPALQTLSLQATDQNIRNVMKTLYPLQGKRMKSVVLSYNDGTKITSRDMEYLLNICVESLNLAYSHISFIPWFKISNSKLGKCLQSLDISNNPIFDNALELLEIGRLFPSLKDLNMCCMSPCAKSYPIITYKINPSVIELFFPPNLTALDLSNNEVIIKVKNSSKFHAPSLTSLDLRKTCTNMCNFPIYGLDKLETLYLSETNCDSFHPLFLANMPSLVKLQIQNSNLGKVLRHDPERQFLDGLKNLKILDLSENEIEHLTEGVFKDQEDSLHHLDLHGNLLTHLPRILFTNIEVIDLRDNKLVSLNTEERSSIQELNRDTKVYLRGNQLFCSCDTLQFLQWLVENKFRIADMDHVICSNTGVSLTEVISHIEEFERNCSLRVLIRITASIGSSVIVIVCITIVVYIFRIKIEYWRWQLTRYLRLRLYRSGKYQRIYSIKYDVFVCYSSSDSSWVRQNIVNPLMSEYNLSVCVYDKDFMIGDAIVDCIIDAVEQSDKVVFVISEAFLKSEWGEFEMEIARLHAIRTKKTFGLIVVLKDDIPTNKMPRQLLRIWYRINCIVWLEIDDEEKNRKNQRKLYKAIKRGQDCTSL